MKLGDPKGVLGLRQGETATTYAESYGIISDKDKAILAWCESMYAKLREERAPLERQWYVNMAFYFGRQNIVPVRTHGSRAGFQLVVPKAPPWRVRLIINHVRRIIRTETAKLTSEKPRPFVVPNTTEDEDLAAARVAEQIVEAKFSYPEVLKTLKSWVWWGSVCGTSFLKQVYDKESKDENGDKGKIDIVALNPFEIFVPDLNQEEIERQPFVLHATTQSAEDIHHKYGVKVNPDVTGVSDMIEDQFLNLVGAQQMKRDKVLVLEYWIKPGSHKHFPNGGLVTVAGGKILHMQESLPYKHEEYPFYKFAAVPTGRFHGDSIIVDLIPIQRELNRHRSQLVESRNLMTKPKLVGYKGSVDAKKITTEPGQFIPVVPGFDYPKPLELPQMPAYVSELEQRLHDDLDDISGQHEVSRGQNPSQVTAATALAYLQEQDDTKLAYPIASIEYAIAKLGRHYLKLFAQFITTPRMVKVVGRDAEYEVQQWSANDLRGNTDVRVEAGSALPRSKAAKQAFVMELMKFNPSMSEKLLELLDLQNIDKVFEDMLADKREAQRENHQMAKFDAQTIELARMVQRQMGQEQIHTPLVRVEDWQNHESHIHYHNQFRKTHQFRMLPPEVKREFAIHVEQHRVALMEGTVSAMQQQQADMAGEEVPQEEPQEFPEQDPDMGQQDQQIQIDPEPVTQPF